MHPRPPTTLYDAQLAVLTHPSTKTNTILYQQTQSKFCSPRMGSYQLSIHHVHSNLAYGPTAQVKTTLFYTNAFLEQLLDNRKALLSF